MGIQSLNGYTGSVPLPAQTRSESAPAPDIAVKPAVSSAPQAPAAPQQQQIEQAIQKLKVALPTKASDLQFSVDNQSGDTVVRVVDSATGDVIRQIPSKELMEISQAIDQMQGLLLKQRA